MHIPEKYWSVNVPQNQIGNHPQSGFISIYSTYSNAIKWASKMKWMYVWSGKTAIKSLEIVMWCWIDSANHFVFATWKGLFKKKERKVKPLNFMVVVNYLNASCRKFITPDTFFIFFHSFLYKFLWWQYDFWTAVFLFMICIIALIPAFGCTANLNTNFTQLFDNTLQTIMIY